VTDTPVVRVGIVGLGLAAAAHVKGYLTHPQAQAIAACDLDLERARCFAAEHAIPEAYASLDAMLAGAGIDAVDIATPTHLHGPMTVQAARAGKHVHCEKPFCRSVAEGMAAVAAAQQNDVMLAVGETYLFITSHVKARQLIEAGEIGRPLQVRQRHGDWLERSDPRIFTGPPDRNWRIDPRESGGGAFPWIFDHAVHFFATAEYLALDARIDEVFALTSRSGRAARWSGASHDPYESAETEIPVITWRSDDGEGHGVWTRAERLNGKFDHMRGFSTIVSGETGMSEVLGEGGHNLVLNGRQVHLILHRAGRDSVGFCFDEGGDDVWESGVAYYSQGHINQVHHFVDCVVNGTQSRYGGEDGVRAVRCTLATIRSAQESRPVRVDEIEPEFTAY
jgi:predicted dehydrogenase